MNITNKSRFLILGFIFLFSIHAFAQDTQPTPTEDEDIKIFTEEVKLNVTVQSVYGKSVPKLTADDLLIVESGDPQTITSIRRVPASVLILLDTGGNLNFSKTIDKSRLTAKILVEKISAENSFAVMQAYDKIEMVSDWTDKTETLKADLDKKLFGGNRSRFSGAINAAIDRFESRPIENRHLIFIGDGLDSIATFKERQNALQNLLAANITFHFIGYNKMEAKHAEKAAKLIQIGEAKEPPRMPDDVLEGIINSMPRQMKDNFRRFMNAERLIILRLDGKQRKLAKQKREDWIKSETELQTIAEDTGGMFHAPEELETMWKFAVEIASAVDSNYVITYTPTKPIAESPQEIVRKIRVSTYLDGVKVWSRQKIVVIPNDKK
ncbi:MAG: hypothetical protein KIS76_15830 [Pyrinomonadaceae bacterium]|nr:hypothetical protein [Pyrinomonadaceae bacterium]